MSARAVFAWTGRWRDLLAGWLFTGPSTSGLAGVTGGGDLTFRIRDELWPVPGIRAGSPHLGSSCWHERTADAGGAGAGKDAAQARRGAGGMALGKADDRAGIVASAGRGRDAQVGCGA